MTFLPFTYHQIHTLGGGQGSTALSAQALFDIAARAQTLFDIAAQRSDPLLPLSAPPFFDISAQRSYLISDRRSALKTSISPHFFMDPENFKLYSHRYPHGSITLTLGPVYSIEELEEMSLCTG